MVSLANACVCVCGWVSCGVLLVFRLGSHLYTIQLVHARIAIASWSRVGRLVFARTPLHFATHHGVEIMRGWSIQKLLNTAIVKIFEIERSLNSNCIEISYLTVTTYSKHNRRARVHVWRIVQYYISYVLYTQYMHTSTAGTVTVRSRFLIEPDLFLPTSQYNCNNPASISCENIALLCSVKHEEQPLARTGAV